ncbi:MAG TPA: hypothetical protein DF715_15665 [Oceanicaulis sp.]|nr:hypothetical protein [Oceanicaulis sp.]
MRADMINQPGSAVDQPEIAFTLFHPQKAKCCLHIACQAGVPGDSAPVLPVRARQSSISDLALTAQLFQRCHAWLPISVPSVQQQGAFDQAAQGIGDSMGGCGPVFVKAPACDHAV